MAINAKALAHDAVLRDLATARQVAYLDAVKEHGSFRAAALVLGVSYSVLTKSLSGLQRRAARDGYAPGHWEAGVAPGYLMGKVTVQRGPQGVERTWERMSPDQVAWQEGVRTFIEDLAEGIRGKSPNIPPPTAGVQEDLLCVYPMGDPHFGMYAWKDETGDDFDLDIAERLTKGAIDTLVASAPATGEAILLNLGDFFHMDNGSNQTPRSHNALDVDTRWAKVMQVGLRAMRYATERLLEHHNHVTVRNVAGNHDPHSSFALALALNAFFENNPRVTIDMSPAAHWFYRFGKVLIGSTHGDTTKARDLPGVMAADRCEDWGASRFRYWYCGHIHHSEVHEFPGVMVEYFRTLAARDAWHSGEGYRAGRDMRVIVHHREFGEVARNRCDIAMLAGEPVVR